MRFLVVMVVLLPLLPAVTLAAGGHDDLDCTGCHSLHDAKAEAIFAVEPNLEAVNRRTNTSNQGFTALCLACHEETGGMGILPISSHISHSFGVAPNSKVANVPPNLLRDGRLECVGCHDPHPSNVNHKYLRIGTGGGSQMVNFCNLCHPAKSGRTADAAQVFNSMDERQGPAATGEPVPPPGPATE